MAHALLIFFILSFSKLAFADRNTGIRAMALANGAIMSSPALPDLNSRTGEWSFAIKGATFSGEGNGNSDRNILVDFKGTGGAFLFSKQAGENWGWYIMAMGNETKGDFILRIDENGSDAFNINLSGVKSSLFMGGIGLSYTLLKQSMLPIQVFAGPGIAQTKISQTVTTTHSTSPDDFDMELNASTPILMAGAQIGLKLTSWLMINPYYVMTKFANPSDRCQPYDRPATRKTGILYDFGDPNCQNGQDSSNSKIEYDTAFSATGVNLVIPSLGLSFNVSSDFEGPKDLDGVEFNMVSASLTL